MKLFVLFLIPRLLSKFVIPPTSRSLRWDDKIVKTFMDAYPKRSNSWPLTLSLLELSKISCEIQGFTVGVYRFRGSPLGGESLNCHKLRKGRFQDNDFVNDGPPISRETSKSLINR